MQCEGTARWQLAAALAIATFIAGGCQQSETDTAAPAEVPEAGPAVSPDPGPAPAGQWEPPVDEAGAEDDAAAPGPDAAVDEATSATAHEPESVQFTAADASETGAGPEEVTLKLQGWDRTLEWIAAQKGKVVVVDFWSTACLPCRREFPHLVELQKAHPERVACLSVSLDYTGRKSRTPQSYQEPVLEFLKQQKASLVENVLSTDDPDELEQRLKLAPIPLVWVYDIEGKLRRTFDNGDLEGAEFTYSDDIVPFVESLLAETEETQNKSAGSADSTLR